jgi:hypothetical protein
MTEDIAHSGAWGIPLIVIVVASWFLYRYLAPRTWKEWASAGVVRAFIIALYAEMYGRPDDGDRLRPGAAADLSFSPPWGWAVAGCWR